MGIDWETTLRKWAKPSSETEAEKCENARRMIADAINDFEKFQDMEIEVFPQGSYRNNTNVRNSSDVDICVCYQDAMFTDFSFAQGLTDNDFGLIDASYPYSDFKNDVESALVNKFGRSSVTSGDKAIDIHESSYRVDADVVACFQHRRYVVNPDTTWYSLNGTQFFTGTWKKIINWPEQNYQNGVKKNKTTSNRFKFLTRSFKRLRNYLKKNGCEESDKIPSYLIESLLWNVPNEGYTHEAYLDNARYIVAHICNETRREDTCAEWGEINELKYLFRPSQKWTREDVNIFFNIAWEQLGFS